MTCKHCGRCPECGQPVNHPMPYGIPPFPSGPYYNTPFMPVFPTYPNTNPWQPTGPIAFNS